MGVRFYLKCHGKTHIEPNFWNFGVYFCYRLNHRIKFFFLKQWNGWKDYESHAISSRRRDFHSYITHITELFGRFAVGFREQQWESDGLSNQWLCINHPQFPIDSVETILRSSTWSESGTTTSQTVQKYEIFPINSRIDDCSQCSTGKTIKNTNIWLYKAKQNVSIKFLSFWCD